MLSFRKELIFIFYFLNKRQKFNFFLNILDKGRCIFSIGEKKQILWGPDSQKIPQNATSPSSLLDTFT